MSSASATAFTKRSGCGAFQLTPTIQPGAFAGLGAIRFERRRDAAEHCRQLIPDQARTCASYHQRGNRERDLPVSLAASPVENAPPVRETDLDRYRLAPVREDQDALNPQATG
jgi:hypothetical protein